MDIQVLYYHVNVHNAINFLMYHTCTHVYYCSCLVLNQSGKWQVITLDTCCSFTRHQIVKYTSITLTMFHHDSCNNTTIQYKIKLHPIILRLLKRRLPSRKGLDICLLPFGTTGSFNCLHTKLEFFFFCANLPIFDSLGLEMWCLFLTVQDQRCGAYSYVTVQLTFTWYTLKITKQIFCAFQCVQNHGSLHSRLQNIYIEIFCAFQCIQNHGSLQFILIAQMCRIANTVCLASYPSRVLGMRLLLFQSLSMPLSPS